MNPFELFSFAKLFSTAMSGGISLSDAELESACKMLKEMADSSPQLTIEQKEIYKMMVDYAKDASKGNH